ncbi:MAG: response regulator [Spirochaetaceae bacterium]|jgi:signal transduction histidine kinase/FixJ family two-component response regulator/HPt (histidine-containing phosphotransfer) domain-containing protein|nr:response regulator [Spirochaetaceae bacterium]
MKDEYNTSSLEETRLIIERLLAENKQLSQKIEILQKKINNGKISAQTDKLLDNIRSVNQKKIEKYMQLLSEYRQAAILILDEHGHITYCANEFLRLAGFDNFDLVNGRSLKEILCLFETEKFAKGWEFLFNRVKNDMRPLELNTKISFPVNSTGRLYTLHIAPIIENGIFEGEIISCYDTTELRNTEAEERTRLMLDATPVACTLWTAEGKLIGWNKKTKEMLGLNSAELNEEVFFSRCPEMQDDNQLSSIKWNNLLKTAIETGTVESEWDCLIDEDGVLPLQETFVRMPWKDNFCVAVYAADLREIRRREMAIRKANEENYLIRVEAKAAEAASTAKSNFLAIMSHELRTPLNVIIGMSELMPTVNLNETQKRYFSDIQTMSKSLLSLINDILDFSKIEADKFDVMPISYSVKALARNIDAMFRHTAEKKGLAFNCYINNNIPDILYGDEIRVRQVFTNIISNAVKYTHTGSINIAINKILKEYKPYMELCVKDTGIGIKPEDNLKMFTVFQQFDTEKNRGTMGTGLGLAISKKLTDVMGGSIDVESEYGKGSIFRVLLPLIEGDPDKLKDINKNCNFLMAKKDSHIRALVVDDMIENNTVAKGFLAMHGIEADTALSGEEAIKKVSDEKYNIIFMDQMMPEMDGLDTTRHIRALTGKTGDTWFAQTPIIALSANVVSGMLEKFKAAGMNDFLGKPIDSKMLNEKLALWLPPAKIEFVDQPHDQEKSLSNEDGGKQLFERIKSIREIDTEKGLSHTGKISSYLKLIKQFYAGFDKTADALRNLLEKNDIKTYNIRVHAVKGVLATLGLNKLSERAKKLEAASTGPPDGWRLCIDETLPFINECREVFNKLPEELTEAEDKEKKGLGDINYFLQNIKELKYALGTGHANSIKILIEKLNVFSFDKGTDDFILELSNLIGCFEYDIALQKIEGFENDRTA